VVTYTVVNDWGNGFLADVRFKNQSGAALNGWTLSWTYAGNQRITDIWDGVKTQNQKSVSVKDAGWNKNVANGGTAGLGLVATYTGSNAIPASFTLNGKTCSRQ